jgi:hypothetical protein
MQWMMRTISALMLLLIVGCAESTNLEESFPGDSLQVLEQAETMQLFSLQPESSAESDMRGWKVLGQLPITDPAVRTHLVSSLRAAMEDQFAGRRPCFRPRHAIRATKQDQTIDVLICFECGRVQVFRGSKMTEGVVTTAGCRDSAAGAGKVISGRTVL